MGDYILYIKERIEFIILGVWVFFMFANWLFDKLDLKIGRDRKREEEFFKRWRTIRKDL